MDGRRSEREWVSVVADGEPLPLGELVPTALGTESCTIARGAGSTERGIRVVVQGLVVDVDNSCGQAVCEVPAPIC